VIKKIFNDLFLLAFWVLSVLLFVLSAYFGATDECKSMGYDTAVFGEYGVYCIQHEVKPVNMGEL